MNPAGTFALSILGISGVVFEGDAHSLTVPGVSGALQVLPGHASLAALTKAGDIVVRKADGVESVLPGCPHGFLSVYQGKVFIALSD